MNILITGGSSGLGKAIVELLSLEEENMVYFTYNRHKNDANEIVSKYKNTHAMKIDFTFDDHIDRLLKEMDEMNLDVLVNNVYVGNPQSNHFHKIPAQNFLDAFKNNLLPTIRITQKALEIFKQKRFGKIINMLSSYILNLPPAGFSIYAGNKAYLQELSRVWNKEYVKYNITSNCIAPDYMETNFSDVDERVLEKMRSEHPLRQLLTPGETAEVVNFLIHSSQQVNGITIPVNAAQILL
jgi:NAD(P)-dependent dehydrogenase (short-subunit alcohol dehydrogenase family)